jgi:pilus assembly protein CpaD
MNLQAQKEQRDGMMITHQHRRSLKNVLGMLLVSSLITTAGCASYSRDQIIVGSVPDDYRTRHPIILSESEEVRDILVPAGASKLDQRGRDVVREIGFNFKSSGASKIAILIPSGSPNQHAARLAARDAVGELRAAGIPTGRIAISHYDASSHGDAAALRVAYMDMEASVASACGTWDEDLTDTLENRNYYNFGCASQNNLAQMVANPADLLGPRGVGEIDSTKRTNVINDWRETTSNFNIR